MYGVFRGADRVLLGCLEVVLCRWRQLCSI